MAELSILRPVVLNGVLKQIMYPEEFKGSKLFTREAYPFPTVTYDISGIGRSVAQPNMPGAPANMVGSLPIGQVSYGMLYVREKKTFDPVTMYWLRNLGSIGTAQKFAEENVRRELEDLNLRTERFVEQTIWKAMTTGRIVLDTPQVKANIDLKFDPEQIVTKTTGLWNDVANATPLTDITNWQRQYILKSAVPARTVYATSKTLSLLARNKEIRDLMSLEQRATYLNTGNIPQLFGMDWVSYNGSYIDDNGQQKFYIPDGRLVMTNTLDNSAFKLFEGPSADMDAQGSTGKFTKSWVEQDPSARQVMVEYTFAPAIIRPAQVWNFQVAPEDFT